MSRGAPEVRWHAAMPCALALLLALWPAPTASKEASYTLRFATAAADGTPWADQLQALQARVEEGSEGALSFRLRLGRKDRGEVGLLRDCRSGEELQGVEVSSTAAAEDMQLDLLRMIELPYLFADDAAVDMALDGPLLEPTRAALKAHGLALAHWSESGWRGLGTREPLNAGESLELRRLRSQDSWIQKHTLRALGAQVEPLPASRVHPYLRAGRLDGFEATPLFALASGWAGFTEHFTWTRHSYQPAFVVYNQAFLDALPADLAGLLTADSQATAVSLRSEVRAMQTHMVELMARDLGLQVNTPTLAEQQQLVQLSESVHEAFLERSPELRPLYAQLRSPTPGSPDTTSEDPTP